MKPFQVKNLKGWLLYLELYCQRGVHCLKKPWGPTGMSNPMGEPNLDTLGKLCALNKPKGAHQLRNRPRGAFHMMNQLEGVLQLKNISLISSPSVQMEKRIHAKGPMETLEAQEEKEPNQEKAPRDVDAPNSNSGKNPIVRSQNQVKDWKKLKPLKLMELKTLENLDGRF